MGGVVGATIASEFAIDYRLNITLDFSNRTGDLSGQHDAYPSYSVFVGSKQVYGYLQTSPQSLGALALLPLGGIQPYVSFDW